MRVRMMIWSTDVNAIANCHIVECTVVGCDGVVGKNINVNQINMYTSIITLC